MAANKRRAQLPVRLPIVRSTFLAQALAPVVKDAYSLTPQRRPAWELPAAGEVIDATLARLRLALV